MLKTLEWVATIAFAILIISVIGIAYLSSPPSGPPREQQSATQYENENQKEEQRSLRGFIRFLFPDGVAIFTALLGLATVGLWWIAIVQIGFLQRAERISADSAKAAKEFADAAKAALIASQRAWIRIDEMGVGGGGLSIGKNGASVSISFVVTNIGNSPAIKISYHPKLVVMAEGVPIPNEQEAVCEAARRQWQAGFTLFPNEQFPRTQSFGAYSIGVSASKEAIERGLEASADKKQVVLLVVGCIDYTFTTDPGTHHQTPFIRELAGAIRDSVE